MKINRKFSIFKFILKILYDILIVFCILLILIIVMQKLTDSDRSVAGFRIFTVVSGSMVPKYNIGEVVICKEVDVNTIKVGDTIVYRGKSGDLAGKIIMHDVVEIYTDEKGELKFHARGLENNLDDPEISANQIYGTCVYESYILTLLYSLATSSYSAFIILFILVLNVFISFKSNKLSDYTQKNSSENVEVSGNEENLKTLENKDENNENLTIKDEINNTEQDNKKD